MTESRWKTAFRFMILFSCILLLSSRNKYDCVLMKLILLTFFISLPNKNRFITPTMQLILFKWIIMSTNSFIIIFICRALQMTPLSLTHLNFIYVLFSNYLFAFFVEFLARKNQRRIPSLWCLPIPKKRKVGFTNAWPFMKRNRLCKNPFLSFFTVK